ncbi:MAG: MAPEG family protein [Parvularculaceae bacterium]
MMSETLFYLALTAMFTAALWIPYIAGTFIDKGMPTPEQYRDVGLRQRDQAAWLARANRVHINAVESFAPFAALALIAEITAQSNATTAMWAMVFFWARVAHAIVYLLGIAYLRTLAYLVGFVAVVALFVAVVT